MVSRPFRFTWNRDERLAGHVLHSSEMTKELF